MAISIIPLVTAQNIALVPDVGSLPPAANFPVGSVRVTENTGEVYASNGTTWNLIGGSGGAVSAVNGQTGVVVVQIGDGTIPVVGGSNCLLWSDASSEAAPLADWTINGFGGFQDNHDLDVDNIGGATFNNHGLTFNVLQDSPTDLWNGNNYNYSLPTTDFDFGSAGLALQHETVNFQIVGGNNNAIGALSFHRANCTVDSDGVNPFDFHGVSYSYGFGTIGDGVNLVGPMQGYGFQWNLSSGATTENTAHTTAFYDNCNVQTTWNGSWTSFHSGPTIADLADTQNYTGMFINPHILNTTGVAGVHGIAISPTIDAMGYQSTFNGLNISPQTSTVHNYYGVNVNDNNVTTYPGVEATLTEQDLTFTRNTPGEDGNDITIEYIGGGTAGSEVVSNVGLDFTVQIENGVSTATQIKAALDASSPWGPNVTTTISGTAGNPQNTFGPTNLAGGTWPGQKLVGYFDGDVQITGALTFGGALSIGALQSFGTLAMTSGSGQPVSVSTLITQPTVAANATLTGADLLGVNTAMLLTVGDNASVSTSFVGLSALGLPAVVSIGTGATVDKTSGATFAISLDPGAPAGGTIDQVALCRALGIPNGTTTVNRCYGYEFDMPFGTVGTDAWGLYIKTTNNNWIEGNLRIGGTTLTDDTTAHKLHVDGAAFFENGNLGFFGTSPVAQQSSSGPQTAGGTYGATEQTMLQEVYDALRAYGLLS